MRIEKISENQIRCTLNQKDLKDREIRISELAYGTDKAKALFRDMIQQASYEFGFEVDDIPLMIEAIPMLPDALVLVITKVEDPDELDTRFSHFTDDPEDMEEELPDSAYHFSDDMIDDEEYADTLDPDSEVDFEPISFGSSIENEKDTDFISLPEALGIEPRPKTTPAATRTDIVRIYQFRSLQELTSLAEHLLYLYQGENTIYKDVSGGKYYLIAHKSDHTPEEFNKICNIISEYGILVRNTYASSFYYEEHFEPLIQKKALQVLGSI